MIKNKQFTQSTSAHTHSDFLKNTKKTRPNNKIITFKVITKKKIKKKECQPPDERSVPEPGIEPGTFRSSV